MNKTFLSLFVVLAACVVVSGCAKKAANSQEAIENSKSKATVQEQVDYLAGQAKSFVNSKNYDQAVSVANYILANLDQNSQQAKDILDQAKAEMQKTAQKALDDMKNKLGTVGTTGNR
jgi:hypothetical protein